MFEVTNFRSAYRRVGERLDRDDLVD